MTLEEKIARVIASGAFNKIRIDVLVGTAQNGSPVKLHASEFLSLLGAVPFPNTGERDKALEAAKKLLPEELKWREEGEGVILIQVRNEDLRAFRAALKSTPKPSGEREKALEEAAKIVEGLESVEYADNRDPINNIRKVTPYGTKIAAAIRALKSTPAPVGEDVKIAAKESFKDVLGTFHSTSCYPKAMDFEIDFAADLIVSRLASANLLRKE